MVKILGFKQWIDLQLHAERIPADEAPETLANSFVEPSTPAGGGSGSGSKDGCGQQRSCEL
jgi:hypothetical protein